MKKVILILISLLPFKAFSIAAQVGLKDKSMFIKKNMIDSTIVDFNGELYRINKDEFQQARSYLQRRDLVAYQIHKFFSIMDKTDHNIGGGPSRGGH